MQFFRSRPGLALTPLVLGLALAGCNETPADIRSDPLIGAWVSNVPGGTIYLFITPNTLTYYAEADTEECADRYAYDIEPLGGNRYLLSSTVNAVTIESRIIATDGELTWDVGGGSAVFQQASNLDPSMLTACAGGGDDPALDCSALPALELGQAVAGELGQGDPEERGRYYEVYGFQPAAQDTAEITLASDNFDPYLYVYRADGTFVAENDDASAGSADAGLTLPVVPVCYRVEVTSFENAETGTYMLRVD